ncbi:DUF4856 domain-containing protein [Colwellia piezophila]|uniref:DUF4856 domain-containing protein n=1 Tax=Colwellia piezophila TaxID=211668 RepID=UPI000382C6FD|nr:DUF4856 domain-containing protein [Colwellia piezophila]
MKFQRKALAIAVMVAISTLTACGSSSSDPEPEVVNTAPTDISLSSNSFDENAKGIVIGTLTATDADANDTFTFGTSISSNSIMVTNGNQLSVGADFMFDYEQTKSVTLDIIVTDSAGASFTKEFTLNVNDLLDYYGFMSKVGDVNNSSVSYGGQSARHALIAELKHYIGKGGLEADLVSRKLTSKADVITKLNTYFDGQSSDWEDGAFPITFTEAKQKTFSDISSSLKTLKGKVAGNDAGGQHKLWNDGDFAGWGVKGSITPTGLIESFFDQLADNAIAVFNNEEHNDPITNKEIPFYVTQTGTDLNQLIQKFLLMSITYSQATDDYLDENKGLAADNITGDKDGTKDYTSLEHQFDEGFGYFGAARDYLAYNDNEISGKVSSAEDGREDWNGQHDTDGQDGIDLTSEFNFGNSVNAAKRDRGSKLLPDGSANPAATDYTKQAMEAFLNGRKLINDRAGFDLTDAEMLELVGYRDTAVDAWERAVVATVIHYINDLRSDLEPLETATGEFDFVTAAKHFSELKGFALGLQFNPYSPISGEAETKFVAEGNEAKFVTLHKLLKDAPVLDAANVAAYRTDLASASELLRIAYNFDADNVANW